MVKMPENKFSLKWEAEKLRRKEVVELYKEFTQAKEDVMIAKSAMKHAGKEFVKVTCETMDSKEAQAAKMTFDIAQKDYAEAVKRMEELYVHLKDLESLKQQSKVDRNVVIKCATFAGITFFTELVELPGNLVNLRAIKVVKPITDFLKL